MQETIRIADGAFEERLGYKFSAKELLERALTHSSAVPELRSAGAEEAVAAVRNSGTAELWVSALSRSSLAENLYPRRSSNAPSPNCVRQALKRRLLPCFPGTMNAWSFWGMPSSNCLPANISWELFRNGARDSFPRAVRVS